MNDPDLDTATGAKDVAKTSTVEAFIHHLRAMTHEQWDAVRAAARDAIRDAGRPAYDAAMRAAQHGAWLLTEKDARAEAAAAAWAADTYAPWATAGYAANEIQGAALMRQRGQRFFFLPMFGFNSPEDIPIGVL